MALSGGIGLEIDIRRIRRDVYQLQKGPETVKVGTHHAVRKMVDEGRAIMTEEIGARVYAIPPTKNYPVRTQRLWQGVRTRDFERGTAAGEVYIDRDILGHNLYFYPLSVEFGLDTHPKYWGRYFWKHGFPKVREMFREKVEEEGRGLADYLRRLT